MNGAHALLATLKANDVDVCFANPGTSEMHFVAALDDQSSLRSVLCLFEGVATGAADGYARVTGRPASTLLHLGPGLANGWANLHNARRAHVPIVNVVGDHATYHEVFDAPLQSDVGALAGALEGWWRRSAHADDVARDTADAIGASYGPPGRVATLILPADVSWGATRLDTGVRATRPSSLPLDGSVFEAALRALRTKRTVLVVGGEALTKASLARAGAIADATSATLLMETFPAVVERGAGVVAPERVIYLSEFAIDQLRDAEVVVLLGAKEPVGFFAYPHVASRLVPDDAHVLSVAPPGADVAAALAALADALTAVASSGTFDAAVPEVVSGELTTFSFAQVVGATLPADVVVVDESNTSGVHLFGATRAAPPHRWLTLTGGAIGYGLPVAVGASIGSSQRVLVLESDGSMMYTLQALWTMAREGLDVTVVALSNRSYAVLNLELSRVGAVTDGAASARLLELDDPTLSLAGLAEAQGVPALTVRTNDELAAALRRSYATPGPMLIEALLPKGLH